MCKVVVTRPYAGREQAQLGPTKFSQRKFALLLVYLPGAKARAARRVAEGNSAAATLAPTVAPTSCAMTKAGT